MSARGRAMSAEMGRIPPHPRCFRMSCKQRSCRIRNLEECTEDGRRSGSHRGSEAPRGVEESTGKKKEKSFWLEGGTPCFFVSVATKGLSHSVSLLFATLGLC